MSDKDAYFLNLMIGMAGASLLTPTYGGISRSLEGRPHKKIYKKKAKIAKLSRKKNRRLR